MTLKQRQIEIKKIMNSVLNMARTKGFDYSSKNDSLSNFKVNAERLGLTKYQIWSAYFGKHIDSIFNAIKHNPHNPTQGLKSESLDGRIIDAITYLTLLHCLCFEDSLAGLVISPEMIFKNKSKIIFKNKSETVFDQLEQKKYKFFPESYQNASNIKPISNRPRKNKVLSK